MEKELFNGCVHFLDMQMQKLAFGSKAQFVIL